MLSKHTIDRPVPAGRALHSLGTSKSRHKLPWQPPSITQIQGMTGSGRNSPPVNLKAESKAREVKYNPHAASSQKEAGLPESPGPQLLS